MGKKSTAGRKPGKPRPLAVFDFDGTLAAITRNPADARIPAASLRQLAKISAVSRVIILTGRQSGFVQPQLRGIGGVKLLGLHGNARLRKGRPLRALEGMAEKLAKKIPGALVEGKPTGFVFHYRKARKNERQMKKLLAPLFAAALRAAKTITGRKSFEFLPKGALTKKETLLRLVKRNPGRRVLFVGDDASDCKALLACSRFHNFRGALVRSQETRCGKVKSIKRGSVFQFALQAISGG